MAEILFISGKGGTGKTSITAAMVHLADNPVICDLDVDAPDLHLILRPELIQQTEFYSGNEAIIDPDKCSACGTCHEMCKYDAVYEADGVYAINPLNCEGCKVCVHFCPEQAIDFPERHCGAWYISRTRMGTMVHAQLFPGQENSGRLVALLRQQARELAEAENKQMIISDGPPGIGCPVISSLSGTDYVVAVTEPTPSGLHDLERVLELCGHFKVPAGIIINKCDLSEQTSRRIEELTLSPDLDLLAKLPFSREVTEAMLQAKAVNELGSSPLDEELKRAWSKIMRKVELMAAA